MAAVLRSQEVAADVSEPELASLLAALVTERLVYFPIRHHSPACARHLERLIGDWKPNAILVEGPASFTSLIPLVLHPGAKAPFAIYTSFVREEPDGAAVSNPAALGPPRHAAYYPFCDYSPELVALRAGTRIGASLRFIDLDYPDQVRAGNAATPDGAGPKVESLLKERHFKRSQYLQALARRAGCRDHNDLWDHFFETRVGLRTADDAQGVTRFIQDVAAWCHFARADATPAELETDGTLAREAAMASVIREELGRGTEKILVVTGGFHTVALPQAVATASPRQPDPAPPVGAEKVQCLVRYSFDQLDALNGYASGMPSPLYYDQLWHADAEQGLAEIATKVLVELGRLTRKRKLASALSTADEIAALDQSLRLAGLRGHPGPMREDLLDGVRSCFVKGAMDGEGEILLGLAKHALCGTSIGEVPPEAGVPPLVGDFRALAQRLRLNISDSVRRKTSLDLYRKRGQRQASRFFHSLAFLDVPFATLVAGPDFAKGLALERLFEHWTYQWTPHVESQLIEASVHGATVEEAAANRLARAIAELENSGKGRCAAEAVAMLVQACRMGLHRHAERLRTLIEAQVAEDPSLTSLTSALNQLVLLWDSREPLEAHRLKGIPALIRAAYARACYLLHNLAASPIEAAPAMLDALLILRDLLGQELDPALDSVLFYTPLQSVPASSGCPPLLSGGVAGLLYADERLPESDLLKLLAGSLAAASDRADNQTAFLTGLLRACRELAWRLPAVVQSVEKLLAGWSEAEFLRKLPHLRMAFADLTPRETDQVAGVVADSHGGQPLGSLHRLEFTEDEMLSAARLNALVSKSLAEDGLASWIDPAEVPA